MTVPAASASLLPSAARAPRRPIQGVLRSRSIVIGGVVILTVVILALCAPYIAPQPGPDQNGPFWTSKASATCPT